MADAVIDARWYAPLLRPVLSTVSPAIEQLELEGDPWSLPRTGLGGALAVQISRGFGRRAGRRAERVTVAALEAYNHRLHVGEPSLQTREAYLARDLKWAHRAWASLLEHDGPVVTRVLDRLLGSTGRAGDQVIPEAVLFLRSAVAAGVVLGDVSEDVHATLDRHVTWLGLCWEAEAGTLDAASWDGALAAVDLRAGYPDAPEPYARERAVAALTELPPHATVALLQGALQQAPRERVMDRSPRAWTPHHCPELGPRDKHRPALGGTLAELDGRWREAIEDSLTALIHTESSTLSEASEYLRRQGGKRVRPLLTLVAAEACEPTQARRALSLAAAVEWLHQGTLVLDDIIDRAQLRRSHATLHCATSEEFATGVAVFVFAGVLRSSQGMHPEIRRTLLQTGTALANGEHLELRHTGDGELSLTDYYRIIEGKTARLFSCATRLGGLAVEAPRRELEALARYGRELGLAFQIIDDLLDYAGLEPEFGKRRGTDLAAAKMTLPLLILREELGGEDRQRLLAALGQVDELDWVEDQMRAHGIHERCRERAATHTARAIAALDTLPEHPARETLAALARELGARGC